MVTQIQQRRDTAANWASANPILAAGEIGFETDTYQIKIGNGTTAWNLLTYENDNPNPTLIATTVASQGGIHNGNFENAPAFTAAQTSQGTWIDGTAAGSATNDIYGWFVTVSGSTSSYQFDTTASHSGTKSIKIVSTTGACDVRCSPPPTVCLPPKYAIPVKANTKYRFSGWMKTLAVATGACFKAYEFSETAYLTLPNSTTLVTTVTDWTYYSVTFTTSASTTRLVPAMYVSDTGTAWFDDLKLEEVIESTSYTGLIPTPLFTSITGVTSTDNIDQAQTTQDSDVSIGNNNVYRAVSQSFTPTKSRLASIILYKIPNYLSPTGTMTITIRTDNAGSPSTTILSSFQYSSAEWTALSNGEITINLPTILTAGTLYWIVVADSVAESSGNAYGLKWKATTNPYPSFKTSADGTSWTIVTNGALYFKTIYSKPTQNSTIICNGEKISLQTDEVGLLSGAVIDVDKGKYFYSGATTLTQLDKVNDVYDLTTGTRTDNLLVLNKWTETVTLRTATFYQASSGVTTGAFISWKINTLLPIRHINMVVNNYVNQTTHVRSIQVSTNNIEWITIGTETGTSGHFTRSYSTDAMNGVSTFYLRAYHDTTSNILGFGIDSLDIDLDTSTITQPIVYPYITNQFTEEIVAPMSMTRVYFRLNKFNNKYNINIPHIEFTDASGVYIKEIPLPLDNSLETDPSINIVLAETTYAQQSGTGANDSTTGYILNDGEYMTLSSASTAIKITYKVGNGTTSFQNITKNVIYLSSNASDVSTSKDGSLRCTVTFWNKVQSLVKSVTDLTSKVNDVINKFAADGVWQDWTPTLAFGTGTPASIIISKARWMKIGKTVFIDLTFYSADSNGCTSCTITLPVSIKYWPGCNTSLSAYQRYGASGTTYGNPLAYIRGDVNYDKIQFAAFNTCTDGQYIVMQVAGCYEIE